MLARLERVLQRHAPGGAAYPHHEVLNDEGYVLLGNSVAACIEDCQEAGAHARTDSLLREYVPKWESGVKHARGWFEMWRIDRGFHDDSE